MYTYICICIYAIHYICTYQCYINIYKILNLKKIFKKLKNLNLYIYKYMCIYINFAEGLVQNCQCISAGNHTVEV